MLKDSLLVRMLDAGVLEVRDIKKGEQPIKYSGGGYGPGYVHMADLLTSNHEICGDLLRELTTKIKGQFLRPGGIAGIDTGGTIPGRILSEYLRRSSHEPINFLRVRKGEKDHGNRDRIVGLKTNRSIKVGDLFFSFDELINSAFNTCDAVSVLRNVCGFVVTHAVCVLFYDTPDGNSALATLGLTPIYLFTLKELLNVAESGHYFRKDVLDDYRKFIGNPELWREHNEFK
jgi:orotate phosphoribosyltransferase